MESISQVPLAVGWRWQSSGVVGADLARADSLVTVLFAAGCCIQQPVRNSGQARGRRQRAPRAWLSLGALGVGVWASLAGAGIASADNQTDSSTSGATPTASATALKSPASKSTRRATRGAAARAAARAGVVDLTGGAFTDLAVVPNYDADPLPINVNVNPPPGQ